MLRHINVKYLCLVVLMITQGNGESVPKSYSSYRPRARCNPSDYMRYPKTTAEVVAIVQEAISRNITVKAFGARHSQTDIICTEGIPIDNHGLKFKGFDPTNNQATFGAGVTLIEATEYLRTQGRAFKTTPGFGNITLAGAIGTGAHGSSIKLTSSISAQVVGVTIVDGFGVERTITDATEMHAFRMHLGLLGIVVDVTLATQPDYKTLAHNYVVSDSVLTDGTAQRWALEADQMSLYWFPSVSHLIVANWTIVDASTPGDAWAYDHVPSTYDEFNVLSKAALEEATKLTQQPCLAVRQFGFNVINTAQGFSESTLLRTTPDFVPIYTEDGYTVKNPAVGYYDKMFAPVCNDGPIPSSRLQCPYAHGNVNANVTLLDNEISVALSDMPDFILAMKDILSKAPASFHLQGILLRFSASSDTYMSNAYGRHSVHFEWYLVERNNPYVDAAAGLAAYQTMMQTLVKRFKGRSHWGKSGMVYHTKEMLDAKLDPTARAAFIAVMNKYDPNGVFLNNFGRRLKGISTAQDLDPLYTAHCALHDDCFCQQASDCAPGYQNCVTLPGYSSYKVCQTIGEKPQVFIPATLDPTVSVTQWMNTTLQSLGSVVDGLLGSVQCLLPINIPIPLLG